MRFRARRICATALVALGFIAAFSGEASAEPPAPFNSPLKCIDEWDNNLDYVGEGWVAAEVFTTNGVMLGCGDELSGVIHIASSDSTGSVHPILPQTQQAFLECFINIAQFGLTRPDDGSPNDRTRYELAYTYDSTAGPVEQTATLIRDNVRGFVWTMFTETTFSPDGNDWPSCAAAPVTRRSA